MATPTENKAAPRDWRFPLATGAGIGVGIAAARAIETNFEPRLGTWGAFLAGLVAAATIAGLVSLVIALAIRPKAGERT